MAIACIIFMVAFSKQFRININSFNKNSVFHCKEKAERKRGLYPDFYLLGGANKKLYLNFCQKLKTKCRKS